MEVAQYVGGIREIIDCGGPKPSEYEYVINVPDLDGITTEQENEIYQILLPILDQTSLLGHTFHKPHGYAGDFELIDRLYNKWMSPKSKFHKWDSLYHTLDAATAVRNRKDYFQKVVKNISDDSKSQRVLNLGSGPCRDLSEYLNNNPRQQIEFDCLDMDKVAIDYGESVCDNHIDKVNFINKNAFRYKPSIQYDLIWSAGLFDYFSDKLFIRLLNRMYALVKNGGQLVVGNFSTVNTSKKLMETFGQWYLNHREEKLLFDLAVNAGVPKNKIKICEEATGVNLFLHLDK